jgi:hypothetical protein
MPIPEGGRWSPQERIVSAGVFTRENDQSFLPQGISNIGGAIVAPFPKGPAFSPTLISSQPDLETMFGVADGIYYGPYSAKEYLKNQGQITVIRVGALGGYIQKNPLVLYAQSVTTQRLTASESLAPVVKLKSCTITKSGSMYGDHLTGSISDGTASAGFIVTGSVVGTWATGPNSGSEYTIGELRAVVSSGSFSLESGSNGDWFTTASLTDIDVVNFVLPYSGSVVPTFTGLAGGSGSATPATLFEIHRTAFPTNPNKASCIVHEVGVYGQYGKFDFANAIVGTNKKVLAVLGNTAFDEAQNLYGFSGSTLISSSNEVTDKYSIVLNSGWLDGEGNPASASYGTYDFSIDPTSMEYIAEVFGRNAQAGQVDVPSGFKIDAAYISHLFRDSMVDVWGEMQASGSWKIRLDSTDSTVFDEELEEFVASYALKFSDGVPGGGGGVNNTAWSAYDIRTAETPWITSQMVAPWKGAVSGSAPASQSFQLFKFHTLAHGTDMNTAYKLEISNVKLAGTVPGSDYGMFDVNIRAYNDTEAKPQTLENFANCSLDPDSVNFVARKIGDKYNRINFNGKVMEFGDYGNKSLFVRVEMTQAPYPKTSVPYGFKAFATPIGGSEHAYNCPTMEYTKASIYSQNRGRYASGVQFNPAPVGADEELTSYYPKGTQEGPELDNKEYNAPLPVGAVATINEDFDLDKFCSTDGIADLSPVYNPATEADNVRMRRFVLGFQGGFNGQSPSKPILVGDDILATNQQGLDCSRLTSSGSVGYKLSINALGNADEVDINLLWTPGIIYNYHTNVVKNAIDMCEARGDCFYVFDIYQNQNAGGRSVQNVVDKAAEFDTNYAATYYPWVRIIDTNTNKIVKVPPSVVMPAVYAQNDRSAAEWFAPAGLNRGGIEIAQGVMDRLTHSERDVLYEGRVNPIVSFPGQGVTVWGQKTLQVQPSALDRINVRRLLIAVKKFIASSSKYLVFEQNVSVTRNRFLSIVNPYLESVQQRSGLYAFRVVMDENNNTPDIIDRNILYGQIFLQPTRTAEFILLDFNVLPTGASFDSF